MTDPTQTVDTSTVAIDSSILSRALDDAVKRIVLPEIAALRSEVLAHVTSLLNGGDKFVRASHSIVAASGAGSGSGAGAGAGQGSGSGLGQGSGSGLVQGSVSVSGMANPAASSGTPTSTSSTNPNANKGRGNSVGPAMKRQQPTPPAHLHQPAHHHHHHHPHAEPDDAPGDVPPADDEVVDSAALGHHGLHHHHPAHHHHQHAAAAVHHPHHQHHHHAMHHPHDQEDSDDIHSEAKRARLMSGIVDAEVTSSFAEEIESRLFGTLNVTNEFRKFREERGYDFEGGAHATKVFLEEYLEIMKSPSYDQACREFGPENVRRTIEAKKIKLANAYNTAISRSRRRTTKQQLHGAGGGVAQLEAHHHHHSLPHSHVGSHAQLGSHAHHLGQDDTTTEIDEQGVQVPVPLKDDGKRG
eukprot:ANDGO_01361.mRNA.1 hypothetical protein